MRWREVKQIGERASGQIMTKVYITDLEQTNRPTSEGDRVVRQATGQTDGQTTCDNDSEGL